MAISDVVDAGLAVVKWPVAVAAVVALPGSIVAAADLVTAIARNPQPMLPFLIGLGLYLLCWWWMFRHPAWGSWLSTLEHEFTHALFAWLTLHRVTGLKTTWSRGGHMKYIGRGNWLISIAPYFFPTVSVFIATALLWIDARYLPAVTWLLGASIAYHTTSTLRETHGHQTDLKEVGRAFAWMFLPTANVLAYGTIIAFACGGRAMLERYVREVWRVTGNMIGWA